MVNVSLGSISHGTLLASDLLPAFYDEAKGRFPKHETVKDAGTIIEAGSLLSAYDEDDLVDSLYRTTMADDMVNDLAELLGEDLPPFWYFGTHPGDGSDFGYWFRIESFDMSVQDRETVKVSELPEHPRTFAREHPDAVYLAVISDHGNIELYRLHSTGCTTHLYGVV